MDKPDFKVGKFSLFLFYYILYVFFINARYYWLKRFDGSSVSSEASDPSGLRMICDPSHPTDDGYLRIIGWRILTLYIGTVFMVFTIIHIFVIIIKQNICLYPTIFNCGIYNIVQCLCNIFDALFNINFNRFDIIFIKIIKDFNSII